MPAGLLSGALYALVGSLLPPGRVRVIALGLLLLPCGCWWRRSPVKTAPASRIVTVGRIAVVLVVLAALPAFVDATADILAGA